MIVLDTLDRTIDGVEDDNRYQKYLDYCDQFASTLNVSNDFWLHVGIRNDTSKRATKLDRMDASIKLRHLVTIT